MKYFLFICVIWTYLMHYWLFGADLKTITRDKNFVVRWLPLPDCTCVIGRHIHVQYPSWFLLSHLFTLSSSTTFVSVSRTHFTSRILHRILNVVIIFVLMIDLGLVFNVWNVIRHHELRPNADLSIEFLIFKSVHYRFNAELKEVARLPMSCIDVSIQWIWSEFIYACLNHPYRRGVLSILVTPSTEDNDFKILSTAS